MTSALNMLLAACLFALCGLNVLMAWCGWYIPPRNHTTTLFCVGVSLLLLAACLKLALWPLV